MEYRLVLKQRSVCTDPFSLDVLFITENIHYKPDAMRVFLLLSKTFPSPDYVVNVWGVPETASVDLTQQFINASPGPD